MYWKSTENDVFPLLQIVVVERVLPVVVVNSAALHDVKGYGLHGPSKQDEESEGKEVCFRESQNRMCSSRVRRNAYNVYKRIQFTGRSFVLLQFSARLGGGGQENSEYLISGHFSSTLRPTSARGFPDPVIQHTNLTYRVFYISLSIRIRESGFTYIYTNGNIFTPCVLCLCRWLG